jgi:hypothetical protein
MSNVNKSLNDVMRHNFRRYMGVLLMKKNTGWLIYDTTRWYPTWQDACEDIDRRQKEVLDLIKKQNPQ